MSKEAITSERLEEHCNGALSRAFWKIACR